MARGHHWWNEPPWWAWAVMVVGAVVVVVGLALPTGHRLTPAEARQADADLAALQSRWAAEEKAVQPPLAVFLGDSYTAGTGATSPAHRWTTLVAAAKGWREVNRGQGGTGYANPGPGPETAPYTDRVAEVLAQHPDVVVVAGGLNDLFPGTITAAEAGAARVFRELRRSLPEATIIAVGPSVPDGSTGGLVAEMDSAVRGVAAEVGATYVSLLDPPVFAAAGLLAADGAHPNDAGHKAIADRVNAGVS